MEELNNVLHDADGRAWGFDELQSLVLQVGSFKTASTRLGLKPADTSKGLRALGVKPPAEYVRSLALADPDKFKDVVIREGGPKKAASWFSCSEAHIRKVLVEIGVEMKRRDPTMEEAIDALNKFGSALLASRLLGCTPAAVKAACPDWKDYRDPLATGRQAVATGRIGEDYWESYRGEAILDAPAKDNPSFPDYDFLDVDYGRVNAKTANPTQEKRSRLYSWTWEVKLSQLSDTFVLVYLDRNRNPIGHFLLHKKSETEYEADPRLRVVVWGNGALGVSIKATSDNPTSEEWVTNDEESSLHPDGSDSVGHSGADGIDAEVSTDSSAISPTSS